MRFHPPEVKDAPGWSRLSGVGARASGYTLIEHTGDLGIRLEAGSLEDVLGAAARALFDILAAGEAREDPAACVRLQAPDRDALMVEWLNELLYVHTVGRWILRRFDVALGGETALRAEVRGERFDPGRHKVRLEIKAATYHGLHLRREGGVWRAQIILDL